MKILDNSFGLWYTLDYSRFLIRRTSMTRKKKQSGKKKGSGDKGGKPKGNKKNK
jgi:hypothetical protein